MKGFLYKVYSKLSNNNKLALISRSGGRETIIFQSAKKYRKYLSTKPEAVNKWIEFIENDLNADISSLEERSRISIPIKKFDEMKLQKMIELIRDLT